MALSAYYLPAADYVQLQIADAEIGHMAFLLTRRQWLNILNSVLKIEPIAGSELPQNTKKLGAVKRNAPGEETPARKVNTLKIGSTTKGLKIVFVFDKEGGELPLFFPKASLPEIAAFLYQQALRADWDPEAALERLASRAAASPKTPKASGRRTMH